MTKLVTLLFTLKTNRWHRRVHEIAPWSWQSDPYLEGMTPEQFEYLRDLKLDSGANAERLSGA